jgi:biotin carboxyl carrier protein
MSKTPDTPYQITVNERHKFAVTAAEAHALDAVATDATHFHVLSDAHYAHQVELLGIDYRSKTVQLRVNGTLYTTQISDRYDQLVQSMGLTKTAAQKINDIKAPMPGLVLEVAVSVGQTIQKGDKVLILEAMKMENVLKAAGDGEVKAIHIERGAAVEKGQVLITLV